MSLQINPLIWMMGWHDSSKITTLFYKLCERAPKSNKQRNIIIIVLYTFYMQIMLKKFERMLGK